MEDSMKRIEAVINKLCISFEVVAGSCLAFMVLVTLYDVIARQFRHPLIGGMEIISFGGAVVIGFALPYAQLKKANIYVDLLVEKLPRLAQINFRTVTSTIGIMLFLFLGYNFIIYGLDLIKTGEVSAGFRLPYYPITFGLALASFLQAIAMFGDLMHERRGGK
jgi:TRAP-type C4-dicarboxylate transport system permease small subunit